MLGTLVFIAISIGVVCVVVLLASRKKNCYNTLGGYV